MPNPYFKFKRFTIYHDKCAMKVGTDGVLLGAWTDVNNSKKILDIGTGSGLIALMLAQRCEASITAIDIDMEAVEQAQTNIEATEWKDQMEVLHTDLCKFTPQYLFDTIVSNPPYITTQEMTQLDKSVIDYEPHLALHGGADGMDFYRSIVENYTSVLKPGGFLCLEYDPAQAEGICWMLENHGYTVLERVRDYNDRERALMAQLRKEN